MGNRAERRSLSQIVHYAILETIALNFYEEMMP